MNILYTAFKGKTNTSKIILDEMNVKNKLYLTNSYKTSVDELYESLNKETPDLIVMLGQYPVIKNSIKIELVGYNELEKLTTTFKYDGLKKELLDNNYKVIISNKTNFLCNNIYYHGLKYSLDKDIKVILLHVPKLKNLDSTERVADILKTYFENLNNL